MWLGKSLVGDRPSWHKEPISFFNKMLSIRKVRLLITSRYIAMQSYECVIISKMFLIYFISYGCNDSALVFLGGAEASASPSFALPMFITIKKIIILHLFLGVPAATVGGTGTPWHTRGYAPGVQTALVRLFLRVRSAHAHQWVRWDSSGRSERTQRERCAYARAHTSHRDKVYAIRFPHYINRNMRNPKHHWQNVSSCIWKLIVIWN